MDKFSQTQLFIKKFKDFKQGSPEFKQCVMMQIERTLLLQDEDDDCTVRIVKYLVADNNLYIVM